MAKRPLATAFGVSALIVILAAGAFFLMGEKPGRSLFSGKVGLVIISGTISNALPTIRALDDFSRDASIKAILLRVESPGGGLAASQGIFAEIERVKKKKPVVCSMGGVAASGGYYVAAPCTKIMANPGTITGSIGVIATIPDLAQLFDKIGLKMQIVKSGSLKAAGVASKPLSEQERAMLQSAISEAHGQFIEHVAQARGLTVDEVRSIATGGIFTGKKAKDLGLVDELGNFNDAVRLAGQLGGISGRPELVLPEAPKRSWIRRLLFGDAAALIDELSAKLGFKGLSALYSPQGRAR